MIVVSVGVAPVDMGTNEVVVLVCNFETAEDVRWHVVLCCSCGLGTNEYCFPGFAKAYVFFSSPINRNLLQQIKGDQSVLSRVGALREVSWLAPVGFHLFRLVDSHLGVGFSFHIPSFELFGMVSGDMLFRCRLS